MASLAMNSQPGYQNLKFPFPGSGPQFAKQIAFGFSGSSAGAWQILNATLYFSPDSVRE
jgi:hypothetical protein